jgi:hypothetical protein
LLDKISWIELYDNLFAQVVVAVSALCLPAVVMYLLGKAVFWQDNHDVRHGTLVALVALADAGLGLLTLVVFYTGAPWPNISRLYATVAHFVTTRAMRIRRKP